MGARRLGPCRATQSALARRVSFLSAESRAALARVLDLDAAEPAGQTASAPLERLAALRALLAAVDADPAALRAVRDALDGGAAWSAVATAAGLAPSAARWRWSGSDAEIAARHKAGRKRSERPSSKPAELPGLSVAEAAKQLGVTVQAVYLRVSRGQLRAETVTLPDGRSYKRVFLE
jgi:transposase-like protein